MYIKSFFLFSYFVYRDIFVDTFYQVLLSGQFLENHSLSFLVFLASHLMFFETVSRVLILPFVPAPASGYFSKKAFISSNLVCVAKELVMNGISSPRYRSFNVYLFTKNSQFSRTQSHTSDVPSGFLEIIIKHVKKSCVRTYFSLVALVMYLKKKEKLLLILNEKHILKIIDNI